MRNSRNRDEKAAGGLPPHSFIFNVAFYYSSFTCPRVQFSPVLATSRSRRTGRSRGFCSRRGSLGKAGMHQEEKGLPTHSRRGREFLLRPKTCQYFLFLMVYSICGTAHPPRSRNYACRIESSKNGGRSPGDKLGVSNF